MAVSKQQQIITSILWVIIFPLVCYTSYTHFSINALEWSNILLLFALMVLTMLLPIKFQNVTVSLERWITFTVFFQYGLFVEFVFIQVAMFLVLFSEKSSLPLNHKFFVNSIVFAITSLLSGFVFYIAGGVIDASQFKETFLYALLYAVVYSLVNNILLKIYFAFNKRNYSLYSKEARWDYVLTFIIMPFSLSIYFLHNHLGNKSLLLVGIPILIVLLTIHMYNHSNTLNNQLSSAGVIGRQLANRLHFDEVIQTFIEKLKDVVPYDNAYVVDLRNEQVLIPLIGYESGKMTKRMQKIVFLDEKTADDGLDLDATRIYYNKKELQALKTIHFADDIATVLTSPIIRNQVTEGYLILTANRKNTFQSSFIEMVDMLTGYFAISLEKARHFENTLQKSERCGLTKLHNYRYLDRKLEEIVSDFYLKNLNGVSVIILDIDRFKCINDQYGHESGNIILVELAKILKTFQGEHDVLARYGGEEFVYIFPNSSKKKAVQFAEKIREQVEKTAIDIQSDLSESAEMISVNITISLGVASIPNDAFSAKEIMRNADRALYIGGKQAGRNKVGIFEEQKNIKNEKTQTLPIV